MGMGNSLGLEMRTPSPHLVQWRTSLRLPRVAPSLLIRRRPVILCEFRENKNAHSTRATSSVIKNRNSVSPGT